MLRRRNMFPPIGKIVSPYLLSSSLNSTSSTCLRNDKITNTLFTKVTSSKLQETFSKRYFTLNYNQEYRSNLLQRRDERQTTEQFHKRKNSRILNNQRKDASTYSTFSAPEFKIDREEAKRLFSKWNIKILTKDLIHNAEIKKVYVPFWVFKFTIKEIAFNGTVTKGTIKKDKNTRKSEVIEQKENISGTKDIFMEDLCLASYASLTYKRLTLENTIGTMKNSLWEELMDGKYLKEIPYNHSTKDFDEVDTYTLDEDTCWQHIFEKNVKNFIQQKIELDIMKEKDVFRANIEGFELKEFKNEARMIYYPIYVLNAPRSKKPLLKLLNKLRSKITKEEIEEEIEEEGELNDYAFLDGRTGKIKGFREYNGLAVAGLTGAFTLTSNYLLASSPVITNPTFFGVLGYGIFIPAVVGAGVLFFERLKLVLNLMDTLDIANMKNQTESERSEFGYNSKTYFSGTPFEREVKSGKDFYTVLGLDPQERDTLTQGQIKASFRSMALKYHPDMHLDEEAKKIAAAKFTEINQAYQVLGNPKKRNMYHDFGRGFIRDH